MKLDDSAQEVLEALTRAGWAEVEVYHKRGRSRTLDHGAASEITSLQQEEGWAVRAGDARRSFFYAASGAPRPDTRWPEADGAGLRLPSPRPVPRWNAPSDLDTPLVGENEARGLVASLARALETELPGARLLAACLEDGSSDSRLVSSREVTASVRRRTASLRLEATSRGRRRVTLYLAARDARQFSPNALARRLADRLAVVERGAAPSRDRGETLLAPELAVTLLAALGDLWIGPAARERAAALFDRRGHLGSSELTLIDDGRLPGGVLEAPVDGEGQPTREVVIVDQGVYRQPLLSWQQETTRGGRASGCALRPGWRDLPHPGATHLYLPADPARRVADLVGALTRGYYLLAAEGAVRIEDEHRRFAVPVSGFAVDGGRPTGAICGAWLTGTVSALLAGIAGRGRDLAFFPVPLAGRAGLVGSPSLLVRGLELRRTP